MKFDPNFILTGLDGKPLEGVEESVHAGKVLAAALFFDRESSDALKYHAWAIKLYAKQPIEIDVSDKKVLIDFIKGKKLPPVTAAPLLECLDSLKTDV